MKMLLSEYAKRNYTDCSRPSLATLKRRIKAGELPGVREGGRWYVLVDANGDPVDAPQHIVPVNSLVRGVLDKLKR